MQDIKVTRGNGKEFLKEIIPSQNTLERNIDGIVVEFKNLLGNIPIKNVAKIHRDKSYENYYLFEKATYNGDNSLKSEIDHLYCDKLVEASKIFTEICYDYKETHEKRINFFLKKKLIKEIKEYNAICDYMDNYELKDNLVELLTNRYNKLDITKVKPGAFLKLFEIDKKTLEEIGYLDIYKEYSEEIVELVKSKEMACDEYWLDFYKRKTKLLNNVLKSIKLEEDLGKKL